MGLTRSFADRPGRSSPLRHPHLYPEQNRRTPNAAFIRKSAADAHVQRNHRLRKRSQGPLQRHRRLPHQRSSARAAAPTTQKGRPPFRTTGLPKPICRTIESLSATPIPRSKALASGNATPR